MSEGFKDLFSGHSQDYAKFHPVYPGALFRYLASLASARGLALDCATGNGQAAILLAEYFDQVVAADPSERQLANAPAHPRVRYRRAAAEDSGLPAGSVDLVTAAQAFHWFRQEEFFREARRVLKPEGILAFWCYAMSKISPAVDAAIVRFYEETLEGCWQPERRLVDEGYQNVRWPFQDVPSPPFTMTARWSLDQLLGYLGTWSAVKTYKERSGRDPLELLRPELKATWGPKLSRDVRWELSLRVGKRM